MAFNEQVVKLVDKLAALSRESKVAWEETVDAKVFQASVSKFVVTIGFYQPPDWKNDPDYFSLEVRDQQNRLVDGAKADSVGTAGWKRLEELHELARRSALHVDDALTDLLSALD